MPFSSPLPYSTSKTLPLKGGVVEGIADKAISQERLASYAMTAFLGVHNFAVF